MATTPPSGSGAWPVDEPPPDRQPPTAARIVEVVVAGVLWVGLALGFLLVGALAPLTAMASDGCGGSSDDGALICRPEGSLLFFGGLGLLWVLLLVAVVLSAFRIVRAATSGRPVWPWPFVGLGIALLGVVVMVLDLAIITR